MYFMLNLEFTVCVNDRVGIKGETIGRHPLVCVVFGAYVLRLRLEVGFCVSFRVSLGACACVCALVLTSVSCVRLVLTSVSCVGLVLTSVSCVGLVLIGVSCVGLVLMSVGASVCCSLVCYSWCRY